MDCKIPRSQGNALGVSICANANAYEETFTTGAGEVSGTPAAGDTTVNVSAGGHAAGDGGAKFNVGDIVHFQETDGSQYEVTAIVDDALTIRQLDNPNGGGLKSALADGTDVRRRWKYYDQVDRAPDISVWVQVRTSLTMKSTLLSLTQTVDITGYDELILLDIEQVQLLRYCIPFIRQKMPRHHKVVLHSIQT